MAYTRQNTLTESGESAARYILEVRDLTAGFFTRSGVVMAVNHVSFTLAPGETLGIVGESGCGKSATAMAILRSLPHPGRVGGGQVYFQGSDLMIKSEQEMRHIRGRQISMIPQDPTASLNPLMRIGDHIHEVLSVHLGTNKNASRQRAVELLETVGIPEARRRMDEYPHQMSGGMRQRVMIAMAMACNPSLLIADEPTTALDATVQAQILELIRRLSQESGSSTILITHNLGIVAGLCDKVAVMYAGKFVEVAPRNVIFDDARHPYTVSLLRCVPRLDRVGIAELESIEGRPPDLIDMPPGCSFAPRCPLAADICRQETPPLETWSADHLSACWRASEIERMKS